MTTLRLVETGEAVTLFLAYLGLWRLKRRRQIRQTGTDPEVLRIPSTFVQAYFAQLLRLIRFLVVALIVMHGFAPVTWPLLERTQALNAFVFDILGGSVGALGLGVVAIAQATMGASWRVGIDMRSNADLVSVGIYRWVRNPTYAGLHLMNAGLWLIWPTTAVAFYWMLFFVTMEFQVRCEEDYLVSVHGERYRTYVARTWRYVPWAY